MREAAPLSADADSGPGRWTVVNSSRSGAGRTSGSDMLLRLVARWTWSRTDPALPLSFTARIGSERESSEGFVRRLTPAGGLPLPEATYFELQRIVC